MPLISNQRMRERPPHRPLFASICCRRFGKDLGVVIKFRSRPKLSGFAVSSFTSVLENLKLKVKKAYSHVNYSQAHMAGSPD